MQGICFIEQLHHATVEGRKQMTRRIAKRRVKRWYEPIPNNWKVIGNSDEGFGLLNYYGSFAGIIEPRYKVGEILYIKEPIRLSVEESTVTLKYSNVTVPITLPTNFLLIERFLKLQNRSKDGFYPKMYIPTWIPKDIFKKIQILAVRCERLQDISDEDCLKEGVIYDGFIEDPIQHLWKIEKEGTQWWTSPQLAYAYLIDKINGKGTWDSNPYVWVYDYKLLTK